MRTIVNVCLTGPFSDGFTYQDNLLPKYQQRLGYRVVVIAPTWRWNKGGSLEYVPPSRYVNEDKVEIIRIENDQDKPVGFRFKTYRRLGPLLEEYSPDIVFLHGLQMRDSGIVARYVKRHAGVRLYVDNHADNSNSASSWLSKRVLHRLVWKHYAKKLESVAEAFWGVLPARVDFLVENYGLPREKCRLLVMGGDDDEVFRANKPAVRSSIRGRYGFKEDDFIVVTGGKIDKAKRQTLLLMDAVCLMDSHVKLLIFGPVAPEIKDEFDKKLDPGKMVYISWANASESYDYFSAADVICFPGRHSVYWEQAAAMGKPLIVKRWQGAEHVDVCGNVVFLDGDGAREIANALSRIVKDDEFFSRIESNARIAATRFLYSDIAKRSIGF